ncbi:hypothetical protein KJ628_02410, partial [Patescibacteria group bacterium]|nr:hypothetical protein [Patescibacteria group bacterium]
ERVREEIIGGLWLANMDWYQFTGEGSDAQNYSSKEAFIKAALEGQTFTLGIPVRADIDWGNVDKDVYPGKAAYGVRPSILFLKMVDGVRLDSINLQIMDADAFKDYMDGKGWLNPENEAYASYATPLENSAISTVNFSVDESGELVISTGSYYVGEYFPYSDEFLVGRFDGEEEIGSQADSAVSRFLGIAIHELIHFSAGELSLTGLDGTVIKYISLSRLDQDVPRDEWYVEPTLFTFAE